jgi:hypothetical protein
MNTVDFSSLGTFSFAKKSQIVLRQTLQQTTPRLIGVVVCSFHQSLFCTLSNVPSKLQSTVARALKILLE